jgi:hypothetical protein
MDKKIIKSSKKTTSRLKKFEEGGMAGKGPLQPTPQKSKTAEELAKETVSRLTSVPGVAKSNEVSSTKPITAPKAKLLPGGFKNQAQKDAYIKSTKNLLKTKSVADLVKMKHGTAAGLASLGFKDSVNKASTPTAKTPSATSLKLKSEGLALKAKGQKQAEKYKKLGGDKQAIKLRQKGIESKQKGAALKQQGSAEGRSFRFTLNSAPTYGKTKDGKGSIETTRTERKNGDKQTRVRVFDDKTGKKKTYYKDEGHRSRYTKNGSKIYINKSGTKLYEKTARGANSTYSGKGLHFAPKNGNIKGKVESKHTTQLNGEYVKIFRKGGVTKSKSTTKNKSLN